MHVQVVGLDPQNFQVYEDRVEQKIEYFSTEYVPASIGLIFDVSGSMSGDLGRARLAASTLLEMGTAEDEYFLITFSDKPKLAVDFTSDVTRLQQQLIFTKADGSTALYDAMYMGVEHVKTGANPRKAIVVLSDGGDNNSRYRRSDFSRMMQEQDVQVFWISLGSSFGAQHLGGQIATALKNQYLIGYRPTNTVRDGAWRTIRVRLKPPAGLPPLSITARDGHMAPRP